MYDPCFKWDRPWNFPVFMTDIKTKRYYLEECVPFMPEGVLGILPAAYAYCKLFPDRIMRRRAERIAASAMETLQRTPLTAFEYGLCQGIDGIAVICHILCEMGVTYPFADMLSMLLKHIAQTKPKTSIITSHAECTLFYGKAATLLAAARTSGMLKTEALKQLEISVASSLLSELDGEDESISTGRGGTILALYAIKEDLPPELAKRVEDACRVCPLDRRNPASVYLGRAWTALCSENHTLAYGNTGMLIALEDRGCWNDAQRLGGAICDDLWKRLQDGRPLLDEPAGFPFPSFYYGYGGVAYSLLRLLDHNLPAVWRK